MIFVLPNVANIKIFENAMVCPKVRLRKSIGIFATFLEFGSRIFVSKTT